MMKLVNIDRRRGEFVVASYTQAPAGFWQMNGYFRRIPGTSAVDVLGQASLEALDASNRVALRDTDPSTNPFAPVLDELGLKNYAQYMKGATSVSLQVDDNDVLTVTPMRNGGAREGFVDLVEKAHILIDWSAESLGGAVVRAMDQADG